MGRDHVPPIVSPVHHHPLLEGHVLQCHRAFLSPLRECT
jgi:hypothetical protein